MGLMMRALVVSPPPLLTTSHNKSLGTKIFVVKCAEKDDQDQEPTKKSKPSLFDTVTQALDFSQVRSEKDAELLDDAREATRSGDRMSREQYGALRRKIGGTYKDFFKSYVEVEGQYVEEGWVDKRCRICKKDTRGEPRQVDKFGRYAHVSCLDNKPSSLPPPPTSSPSSSPRTKFSFSIII